MRLGFIFIILTIVSCSPKTTARVYIDNDNLFGDITDGYPDRSGLTTYKNSAGQILAQGQCAVSGNDTTELRVGLWKEFYENRNVKIEGSYKIGSYVDCCFAGPCRSFYFYKVGQWKYYNSAGELDYEIEFTPATLRIDTRCEGGDTLIFGLIKTIPVKYWSKLTADKVYELQKISVRYRDSFGTTTYIPLNEELFIEFKADE